MRLGSEPKRTMLDYFIVVYGAVMLGSYFGWCIIRSACKRLIRLVIKRRQS